MISIFKSACELIFANNEAMPGSKLPVFHLCGHWNMLATDIKLAQVITNPDD